LIHVRRVELADAEIASHLDDLLLGEGSRWDQERGRLFLADADNALFLAEVDGASVGYAVAHRLQRFDARNAEVLIYDVGVGEAYQRRGVGRALIERVVAWAREVGADEVWVLADADDARACAFYAATGGERFPPGAEMFTYRVAGAAERTT